MKLVPRARDSPQLGIMSVTALTFTLLISITVAAPAAVRQGDGGQAQRTIAQNIGDSSDFTILAKLVEDAGLGAVLSAPERKTLFAPTDTGFATTAEDLGFKGDKNDPDAVRAYLVTGANGVAKRIGAPPSRALAALLSYHVSGSALSSKQVLQAESIPTLLPVAIGRSSEKPLALIDLAPAITDPNLIEDKLDISSSNGVIHGIDRMLQRGPMTKELFLDAFAAAGGTQAADDADDEAASSGSPDAAESSDDPAESAAPTVVGRSPGESARSSDEDDDGSACFPASATVHLSDGSDKPMHAVVAGDLIRHTVKEGGAHSKVYAFSHRVSAGLRDFVRIESDSGHVLTASRNHYVYANGRLVVAAAVKEGDVLTTLDGPARVGEVKMVKEEGLYAPHTMHGDIVVDRVLASSYTQTLHPTLAHFILAPVRLVARMGVKEPLGKLLYEGADKIAEWVPAGPTLV